MKFFQSEKFPWSRVVVPLTLIISSKVNASSFDRRSACVSTAETGLGFAQPIVTDRVIVRGRYQTLPIALYGFHYQASAPDRIAGARAVQSDLQELKAVVYELRQESAKPFAAVMQSDPAKPPFLALPRSAVHALQVSETFIWGSDGKEGF